MGEGNKREGTARPWMGALGAGLFLGLMATSWMAGGVRGEAARTAVVHPARIVSLAPSVTEILFALGMDQEIVGVTDFCNYPPAAREKARVGGFKGKSLEAIIALSPDLVIGTRDGNEEGLFRTLERLRVPLLTVQPRTLAGVIESARVIGRATDRESAGEALARTMEKKLSEVRARVRGARRVRVMLVYGRDPLVLAGPGTFADDLIREAGGENVAGTAGAPYPRFSLETVLALSPEVIIEGAMGSERVDEKIVAARSFWSRWGSLPAVQADRIVVLDQDLIARPGPRIFDGLFAVARALHPEIFKDGRP